MRKSKGRALAIAMAVILVMVMSVVVGLAPPVMSGYENTTDESNWNASSEELIPVIILLNTDAFVTGSDSAAGNTSFDAAKQEVSSILEADELQPMGWGTGRGRGRIKRDFRIIDAISADVPLSLMDTLTNSRAVKAIYLDRKVHALLANSVPLIHASDAWQLQDSEGNNVTGKGVLVAVLDTGVDYMHPDLGGGFGPKYKVVGGYDFVNDDGDPMDDNGHGTLVAGIVAANGNLKGVAPDAKLLAYKVLDNNGSGYESDVIAGIERAIEDGAAIMSMSFGFSGFSIPLNLYIDYAFVRGVIIVAAAGNDGPGFGTINSPASHKSVIAVGDTIDESILEVQTLEKFDQNASQLSENKKLESLPMKFSPHTSVTGEIAYAGLGYPENFSSANTTFTGKVALIKRGILTFEMKVKNAFNAGATGAIIFNNQSGYLRGTLVNKSEIPAVSILDEEGKYLLDLLNLNNEPVIVNLTIKESIWMESSRGPPCTGYTVKPDLVAPGCGINTTATDGKYVGHIIISGTSFSAPHVSGACVLLLQLHPDWTPGMIKAALMNNAKDIGYGVFEQGAGRVDVLKAATPEFIATPPSIGFYVMKPTSSNNNKKIKVENLQNYTIPVNVSVVREQGMYLNFTHININSTSFNNVKINVTPDFTLHPKENEQIDFTITVPENYTAGYYCGKILMKSNNHSISIPFALTLKKSTLPWIFPDIFSATPSAVSNAEAGKQLEPSESKKK